MEKRDVKAAMTHGLQGVGVNNTRLVKVLAELRRDPRVLHEVTNRGQLDRAQHRLYDQVAQVGPLQLWGGGEQTWHTASLPKLILRFSRISKTSATC